MNFNRVNTNVAPHSECGCGGMWILRRSGITGNTFLGCSKYPECRNTFDLGAYLRGLYLRLAQGVGSPAPAVKYLEGLLFCTKHTRPEDHRLLQAELIRLAETWLPAERKPRQKADTDPTEFVIYLDNEEDA